MAGGRGVHRSLRYVRTWWRLRCGNQLAAGDTQLTTSTQMEGIKRLDKGARRLLPALRAGIRDPPAGEPLQSPGPGAAELRGSAAGLN